MGVIRFGIDYVARCAKTNPARAAEDLPAAEADPFAVLPGHDFRDAGVDFWGWICGELLFAEMIALEEMLAIEQVEKLCLALDEDGKFRARDE